MKNEKNLQFGLLPTPPDDRDFSFGGLMGKIELPPLQSFMVAEPLDIKDQEEILPDGCTGFSLTSVSELQEGVILDPGFTFAMIKKIRGEYKQWGGDLRSGCKVGQNIGFIEVGQNPSNFSNKPRDFIANWNNWDLKTLEPLALKHKKQSYFNIDGDRDTFDNFRAALWQNKDQKQAIYTGCLWKNGWLYAKDGFIPRGRINGGTGHAFYVIGQEVFKGEPYLVVPNSYGKDAGKNGLHYFPREVVNREFTFSGFQFNDMPREEAEKELEKKGLLFTTLDEKKTNNPFENFKEFLKRILNI